MYLTGDIQFSFILSSLAQLFLKGWRLVRAAGMKGEPDWLDREPSVVAGRLSKLPLWSKCHGLSNVLIGRVPTGFRDLIGRFRRAQSQLTCLTWLSKPELFLAWLMMWNLRLSRVLSFIMTRCIEHEKILMEIDGGFFSNENKTIHTWIPRTPLLQQLCILTNLVTYIYWHN